MGFAFRMMIWVVGFNLAVGVVIAIFGQGYWTGDISNTGNDMYEGVNQTTNLFNMYNTTSGVPVEEASFWYRFLDVISLGFYEKIKLFLKSTIFSIPTILGKLVPTIGSNTAIITILNSIISIIFVLGMFELFTGKGLENR